MLSNAYFLAKIGADTAENEQHCAEILPKAGNYPTGPPGEESAIDPAGVGPEDRAMEEAPPKVAKSSPALSGRGTY